MVWYPCLRKDTHMDITVPDGVKETSVQGVRTYVISDDADDNKVAEWLTLLADDSSVVFPLNISVPSVISVLTIKDATGLKAYAEGWAEGWPIDT